MPVVRTVPFGTTFTWPDGSSVNIDKRRPFKPSRYASLEDQVAWPKYEAVNVTVVNAGASSVPVFTWLFDATTGGRHAGTIFDLQANVRFPLRPIKPKTPTSFVMAFGQDRNVEFAIWVTYGEGNDTVVYR